MHELTADQAIKAASRILEELGTPSDVADRVAGWLVASDLSGHPSHGIIRVHDYAERIAKGSLDPMGQAAVAPSNTEVGDSRPVVLVDAAKGYGHPAADLLVRELVKRVRIHGVAVGGIANVSHTGRLGEWSEQAARAGVILFLCDASLDKSNVVAFGAKEARLGTNPLTFGVPATGGEDLIIDFATSGLAGGKMQHYIETGQEVPAGNLLDSDGNPTVDPTAFLNGGMLQTFGGHKGYGLSLLVSVLAGCVVGQAASDLNHGVFAVAVDPACFAPEANVLDSVKTQLDRMRDTPAAQGVPGVQVPGDFERKARADGGGVLTLPDNGWTNLLELAASLGLTEEQLFA